MGSLWWSLPAFCAAHTRTTNERTPVVNDRITTMSNPWAKRDAWRYEGQFSRFNRFKSAFPGLGIAIGAFSVYVAYEKLVLKKGDAHDHH